MPTLARLAGGPHAVCAVVSQPDRRRGRGRRSSPSPVSAFALETGLPLLRPERVGAPDCVAALASHEPDLGVVVAFGQFIPKSVRELPRLGYLINAHASLLPKFRGAAPIQHAILAGEKKTGISVMRVEREMDAGPVALVRETPIGDDEDAGSLATRLGELAADAIAVAVDRIAEDDVEWTPQDAARATLAPKIEREDTRLDFAERATALVLRVRALAPAPGAFTTVDGEPLRILSARADAADCHDVPGTVRRDPELRIATGGGWLVPLRVQRAGGKAMDVDAFLRGRDLPDGTRLGDA